MSPMETLLDDLSRSISNETFYSALTLALALPDMCSQIENGLNSSNRNTYISWVDAYMDDDYFKVGVQGFEDIEFSGIICYALRCRVLHNLDSNINDAPVIQKQGSSYTLILDLVQPKSILRDGKYMNDGWTYNINNILMEATASIDIMYLCNALYETVRKYYTNSTKKAELDTAAKKILCKI